MKKYYVVCLVFLTAAVLISQQEEFDSSLLRLRYPLESCDTIYLPAYHPINLFDNDSRTFWMSSNKSTLDHELKMEFSNKLIIDKIVFHKAKPDDPEYSPVGSVLVYCPSESKKDKILNFLDVTQIENEDAIVVTLDEPTEFTSLLINITHKEFAKGVIRFSEMELFYNDRKLNIDSSDYVEKGKYF